MAELTSTKLNPESHLLLDQPLLRLPAELSRKNFKLAALHVEHDKKLLLGALRTAANDSLSGKKNPSQALDSLDNMVNRMKNLKRKMEGFHEDEKTIYRQTRTRLEHLRDLYQIPSLADVKYDEWSRIRLNRLMVDYLLRSGFGESATALAKEKGIEDLVDLNVFVQCHKVEESLRRESTQECLAWCSEHRELTRKTNVRTIGAIASQFMFVPRVDRWKYRVHWSLSSDYSNLSSFDGEVNFWKPDNMRRNTFHQTRRRTPLRSAAQQDYSHTHRRRKSSRTE